MLVFAILLVILLNPVVLIGIQDLTPKEAYPIESLIITQPAQAQASDVQYCYPHISTITVSVVFYNTQGDASWMIPTISELSKASITISVVKYHYENTSAQNFYDIEYEQRISNYMNGDNSMLVVSFTNLIPQPADSYSHLAGFSLVRQHLSIVLTPSLRDIGWSPYIALHEICHNLGFFPEPNGHSTNSASLMYPIFSGSNTQLLSDDIALLQSLH